jgi:hypothetical protein
MRVLSIASGQSCVNIFQNKRHSTAPTPDSTLQRIIPQMSRVDTDSPPLDSRRPALRSVRLAAGDANVDIRNDLVACDSGATRGRPDRPLRQRLPLLPEQLDQGSRQRLERDAADPHLRRRGRATASRTCWPWTRPG